MAFSMTIRETTVGPSGNLESSVSKTGSGTIAVDDTIANGQTAFRINVAIDVSAVTAISILSDQDITVKTNSSGAPDDTFTLQGGQPYTWHNESLHTFILGTDVTAIFVANASGSTATLKIQGTQDASP